MKGIDSRRDEGGRAGLFLDGVCSGHGSSWLAETVQELNGSLGSHEVYFACLEFAPCGGGVVVGCVGAWAVFGEDEGGGWEYEVFNVERCLG